MSQAATSSASTEAPRSNSTLSWLTRLAKKELSEILRDRRTIITLVLMPLLVYPLLAVAFRTLALSGVAGGAGASPSVEVWNIDFEDAEDADIINDLFGGEIRIEDTRAQKFQAELENANGKPLAPPDGPIFQFSPQGGSAEKMRRSLQLGEIDLGVRVITPLETIRRGEIAEVELLTSDDPKSQDAKAWFEKRLRKANDDYRVKELERLKHPRTTIAVVAEDRIRVLGEEGNRTISFAALIPLILVLMTITGAVYPAIDLTAGERERNTLEALIASPAPRFALLLAKYTAVLTVALLTSLMNLTAMSATIWLLGLGKDIFGAGGFSFLAIVEVAGLMMLFAAFFSGVLLAVTSFARSFKEAQAYLIPLMLLSLAPGMMSLMPGISLAEMVVDEKGVERESIKPLVVVPLVNLVVLTRDLLLNKASTSVLVIVVFSTALYAMAAVALAARVFGADSVLYGREGSWSELFTRPREKSNAPSMSAAFFCLAALFVVTFLTQSALAMVFKPATGSGGPVRLEGPILASGLGNLLIFGGVCFCFAWLGRVAVGGFLPMKAPSVLIAIAVVILGLGSWPIAHEILAWMNDLGIAPISQSKLKDTKELMQRWETVSPLITLLSLALITPIGEEIAFRGYLYSAFETKKHPLRAILVSSVLFAAFHVVASGVLQFERFGPSLFLGLILGLVRQRSGSIWPSLFIHVLHNGLLLSFAANQSKLAKMGFAVDAESLHLPVTWQLASAAAVAIALGLAWVSRRPKEQAFVGQAPA